MIVHNYCLLKLLFSTFTYILRNPRDCPMAPLGAADYTLGVAAPQLITGREHCVYAKSTVSSH